MTDRAPSGLVWPTIAAGLALAVLSGLGTWQLERKAWKEALIAQIAARATAAPVSLDAVSDAISRSENLEYTRVTARGRFHLDKTLYVFAPEGGETGWHAHVPLETTSGRIVLVNRGWIGHAQRQQAAAPVDTPSPEVELVGLLRHPGSALTFTPDNDVARNIWHWRDVSGMARATFPADPGRVMPFTLDREADPTGTALPGAPRGGVTRVVLPNRHLEYALTWYGLALTLLAVYVSFAWPRWRGRTASAKRGPDPPSAGGNR